MKSKTTIFSFIVCLLIAFTAGQKHASDLNLEFVQLVTRHGARTPFETIPNSNEIWYCSLDELSLPDKAISYQDEVIPRVYRKKYIPNRSSLPGTCISGQLTQEGFENHYQLGQHLRDRYVNELNFLPKEFDPTQLYLRSTDSPRTLASAQAQMLGLYPPETRTSSKTAIFDINTLESAEETLAPSTTCPKLNNACDNIQKTSAWQAKLHDNIPLRQKLMNMWNTTQLPWWVGIYDNLYARQFHNMNPPVGVTPELYEDIADFALWQLKTLYNNTDVCRLGIGRFLGELVAAMENWIDVGPDTAKWHLYSAHDVTIGLILSSLDIFQTQNEWPQFAANLIFELLSDSTSTYYVRLIYNGKPLEWPHCDPYQGDHTICSFDQFSSLLTPLIPTNYQQECNSVQRSPLLPEQGLLGDDIATTTAYLC